MDIESPPAVLNRRDLVIILLLAALLFLPGIGQRDLWNPDEPRYAEVTREMLESGPLMVPHLNGEIYAEKPPLLFWAIALAATVTGGLDEVAVRLPAALSAIGTVLLIYWLGLNLFDRRVAWLAALAFATCRKIMWQGQDGQIDMLLVFLVTLAVCCWVYGFKNRSPGYSYLFFLAAGLATLAKGPVGLLPPLLSIIAFLIVTGRKGEIGQVRIGRGMLIWVLVVLAWLIPAALTAGSDYLQTMVFKQNVTRFADPWHHFRPWYY
jgi:4-amino-4-deoxy-L-arabinose transferase-like glycosyltransferase